MPERESDGFVPKILKGKRTEQLNEENLVIEDSMAEARNITGAQVTDILLSTEHDFASTRNDGILGETQKALPNNKTEILV